MGWLPSTYRHYYEILKWWIKIRSYEKCRIAKQVFQWSIELSENDIKNWSWQFKKLLMYVRMPDLCNMVRITHLRRSPY